GKTLARELDAIWSRRYPHMKLPTISAEGKADYHWFAGVYSKFKPTVNSPHQGAWCSDAEVCKRGGLVLWENTNESDDVVPQSVIARFPDIHYVRTLTLRYTQNNPAVKPLYLGVGLVPPNSTLPQQAEGQNTVEGTTR
ncbi:MAG: hypothetical protein Q4G59_13330, partial [Planctomycetia bacterium]|nr:hypothetical protein [Planctomycetia bacterium]